MNEQILASIQEHYTDQHSAIGDDKYAVIVRRGWKRVDTYYPATMTAPQERYYYYVCVACGRIIPTLTVEELRHQGYVL